MEKIIFQCPECGNQPLSGSSGSFHCTKCNCRFPILENNIPDLRPQNYQPGANRIYRHSEFEKQFKFLSEIRRYFYTKKLAKLSMSWGHKNVVRLLGKEVKGHSIDLGVGCGDHYQYIANGEDLIGLDYDIEALNEFKKSNLGLTLIRADLTRLPFPDKYFDSIRSTYAFEHLYYLENCLEEIYRTLKEDGVFVASFPIVGGWFMDLCSKLGPQKEFNKKYGLDWKKILKIEHCNSSRRIMEAIRRIFIIDKTIWSPWGIPSHNLNMFITIRARKNLEYL